MLSIREDLRSNRLFFIIKKQKKMRQKIRKSKLEACKLVWKKRITAEKGISDKCAEKIAQECIRLIERMLYGNAMIAFHRQDGTFCLEKGTLVGYEKFFHRKFNITAKQESIVYWSEEQKGWRRFMIGNLMEWKAIV